MNDAIVSRVNPWLIVALVAVLVLLVAAVLVASQPGLIHAFAGMIQGPQQMAPVCNGLPVPC